MLGRVSGSDDADEPRDDEGDEDLAREVLAALEQLDGRPCARCGAAACGHEHVVSLAFGLKRSPLCLACLSRHLEAPPARVRDRVLEHVRRRACFERGWLWASAREGFGEALHPPCLWPPAGASEAPASDG